MNWSTASCSWMNFERATWRLLGSNWYLTCCSSCRVIRPCTWLERALSFYALFLFLYLCRAAHGSADIPILPHAHTILLKHAVNLRRRRTLFNERLALSSPFCKCTNHAVTQLLDSPKNSGGPLPCYLPCLVSRDFRNYAIIQSLMRHIVAFCH